jgi:hypothetical protein
MKSSDVLQRPQLTIDHRLGDGYRRKLFVELHKLEMRGEGVTLLAGESFLAHLRDELRLGEVAISQIFRRSYGEVLSWDLTGNRNRDFPADNYFNVFFALRFDSTTECPAFTLYNKDPVLVVDLGLTSLPPLGRVTIPQFPFDLPHLYIIQRNKSEAFAEPLGIGGEVIAAGGCCAHSVRGLADLPFRPVNFPELAGPAGAQIGAGLSLRTGQWTAADARGSDALHNRTSFFKMDHNYIDGVFVPNGITQISSTGLTFRFDDTHAGGISDAIRQGASVLSIGGELHPMDVTSPHLAAAYQSPQSFGVGLGPNGGITFNIASLRERNPDFYLVALVALMGMSAESPRGSKTMLRVLVDGVEVPFASNEFTVPGVSIPISVDLQVAERFVTLSSTSSQGNGNGVFGLFQLRGFGNLAGDAPNPYRGPARPNAATLRQFGFE